MRNYADIPFAPRRFPFFYGWFLLAFGTLGTVASIPGQTMGVSVFTDYLIEALGLSREGLSLAYMAGTITSSFILPFGGKWIDRLGARLMMVLVTLALGVSLCALGVSDRLLRAAIAIFGEGSALVCAAIIGFFVFLAIRFFGQGMVAMVPRVMIGKWFKHRRGLAAGISGVVVSAGFAASPKILDTLIIQFDWRNACFILAAAVALGMGSLALIFYRDNPAECGLTPDGIIEDESGEGRVPKLRDFTLNEARLNFSFWVFSLGLGAQGLIITAVTFHLVAIGVEAGIERNDVFNLFLYMPFFSVTSNLIGGWLSDRMPLNRLLMFMMAMQAIGTGALVFFNTPAGFWLAVAGFGLSGGMFGCLVTWPSRELGTVVAHRTASTSPRSCGDARNRALGHAAISSACCRSACLRWRFAVWPAMISRA
jgi:MFS transporter, OFA family, oxalate/formate antiporter